MAYEKVNWQDGKAPALNAENLNHMDEGIYEAQQTADEAKQAVNNVIYDETLEKESNNYFYADFSSIDFTQYRNLKLIISLGNSGYDSGSIYFYYEKDKYPSGDFAGGSQLNSGNIISKAVNYFNIYHQQVIDMQYCKISFGNQTHIGISAFTWNGFLVGKLVFGTGYSNTGPNFWGIGLNYGASYTGTVRVTITGDKIN